MKLIETPISKNMNLETLYPNISKYAIENEKAIKLYKLYSYDRTNIVYLDRYDKISLLLLNRYRKISHNEVDTIIHRVLKVDRKDVTVDIGYKQHVLEAGIRPKYHYKDIIMVDYQVKA